MDKARWIASYPKSGNTWVRMFINAYCSHYPVNLNTAFQFVSTDLPENVFAMTCATVLTEENCRLQFYVRPAMLINAIQLCRCKEVGLKTHHGCYDVDGMPLIPPRLTVAALYIVRDPRDIAGSFAEHIGKPVDHAIELMGTDMASLNRDGHLCHMLGSWSSHVTSWAVNESTSYPTTVVRYEDMLAEPDKTFRAILHAFGFKEIDEQRFAYALEQSSFAVLRQAEARDGFRELANGERFFRHGQAGRWRETLTGAQIERIETDHGAVMRRFEYNPECVLA